MKVCLVGCGAHARSVYAPTLARLAEEDGGLSLAACCDISEENAKAMQALCGFGNTYSGYARMLEAEKPDAVIAVTPYFLTGQVAADILSKGYPLLLEKPPGDTRAACGAVANAAAKSGAIHQVAFNRHYMPLVAQLYGRIHGQGKPVQNIDYCMYRINRTEDFFFVTAIHGIDLVGYLAQSPYRSAAFSYQMLPQLGENHYNIFMDCRFESGAAAQLRFLVLSGMISERVIVTRDGECAGANLPIWHGCDTPGSLRVYRDDRCVEAVEGEQGALYYTNGFYHQLQSFFAHVRAGKQPRESAANALQMMELAECVRYRRESYGVPA